ncbi:holo-ACP synthase [Methylobacterium persicinum]|uniref:Holo-[acyl-carrier-protein] synthase n=1 Tax=Methylobacterium persicinum TaxID=374426 RepID=A0ABU0HJ17_9HYPH|nr:holo-ACP synthase [Methylobacterium persicinum]MDQ0442306.1 holo-[acyl-carrier protein] synthase [Methylobacterium persicinum]GJE37235.1 Holo-[acyl-carrier-protein] synthase [Methylobacterium persicinum]
MILGIGSDLCDIRRIEKTLSRHGERFTHRVYTDGERARCERRAARAEGYARRFAAKEACAKALGTGLSDGVFWRDMEVVNLPSGQPTLRLTGGAARRLAALLPAGHTARVHVSLTDDPPLAQAFVVIEAIRD